MYTFLLMLIIFGAAKEGESEYTYLKTSSLYKYRFEASGLHWEEAKLKCEAEGAKLFYPENKDEVGELVDLWYENQAVAGWIWVGAYRKFNEFLTIDDQPITEVYQDWSSNEPNNYNNNENCVTLFKDGTLNDNRCSESLPYICKLMTKTKIPEENVTSTKEFEENGLYNKYRFEASDVTWERAKINCETLGAKLFYPKNEDEAREFTDSNWNVTEKVAGWIWVGAYRKDNEFLTIDDEPIMYQKWSSNEPNNFESSENCVTLFKDGTLNDNRCSDSLPYVCKFTIIKNQKSEENLTTTSEPTIQEYTTTNMGTEKTEPQNTATEFRQYTTTASETVERRTTTKSGDYTITTTGLWEYITSTYKPVESQTTTEFRKYTTTSSETVEPTNAKAESGEYTITSESDATQYSTTEPGEYTTNSKPVKPQYTTTEFKEYTTTTSESEATQYTTTSETLVPVHTTLEFGTHDKKFPKTIAAACNTKQASKGLNACFLRQGMIEDNSSSHYHFGNTIGEELNLLNFRPGKSFMS